MAGCKLLIKKAEATQAPACRYRGPTTDGPLSAGQPDDIVVGSCTTNLWPPHQHHGGIRMSVESRFTVDKSMKFRVRGTTAWRRGRTRNVSRSGLLFACYETFEVGTILELALLDDDLFGYEIEGKPCLGEVVRRAPAGGTDVGLLIGVRFVEAPAQDVRLPQTSSPNLPASDLHGLGSDHSA